MEPKLRILLVLTIAATLVFMSNSLARDNDGGIPQRREGQRMQRPGEGPGPRPDEGFGRRGPGRPEGRWRRPELTDEQIDNILGELKKRDPNTAQELAELRTKDPEEFRNELRRHAGPEIGKVIMEMWANRQRAEFFEWLEKYVPKVAEELTQLKEEEPELYAQKYDLTWQKYRRIYDRARRSPELAKVLVADLQLAEREETLHRQIRTAENETDKNELMAQLENVVSDRYDLIVRQKQIEYEQLLKRLEELQKQVRASLEDIAVWRDPEFKAKNVKERIENLTEERKPGFQWH
jgi:hypothetical protein